MKSTFVLIFAMTFSILSQAASQSVCDIKYDGTNYFVTKDGQKFSPLYASLDSALQTQTELVNANLCVAQTASKPCRIEFNQNRQTGQPTYSISIGDKSIRAPLESIEQALMAQRNLVNAGRCLTPITESCSVEYDGTNYFVSRNKIRFSSLYSVLRQATDLLENLRASDNCR